MKFITNIEWIKIKIITIIILIILLSSYLFVRLIIFNNEINKPIIEKPINNKRLV